ncbi:ABC transporter ATP-binding protein [Cystobacter fuscus]|uniref:ABC transporter ATP-binding protein n=1 Tax=Cystobacter fuscus TaxID=43 RepID=UPI002B303AD7|nr:ABC transporter ATP-binding protein [Cystobacter fuscus]
MILSVQNLNIGLPIAGVVTPVIRGISFELDRGEILGVVGESGCGKSITNLAIMGLLPPGSSVTADRFELCGHDLLKVKKREWPVIRGSKAAMIFQNPMSALNPSLSVGTQLAEAVRKAEPDSRPQRVMERSVELLNQVGISSPRLRLRAYPHELSGGMAQRVMIAMAIACGPSLLIADEPTTGLDVTVQAQILELLLKIRDDNDMAVILVSHDIGVIEEYADRIQVMYSGQIVETGPTEVLSGGSRHPYTRGLLHSLPARQGAVPKMPLVTIPGVVPPIGQSMSGCRFAPRCSQARDLCQSPPMLTPREDFPSAAFRCHF